MKKKSSKEQTSKASKKISKDYLGLSDTERYPKYVKLYNFFIKKYVFLNPNNNIEEIDLYQSDHDYNTFYY